MLMIINLFFYFFILFFLFVLFLFSRSSVDISSHPFTLHNECSNYDLDISSHINDDKGKHDFTLDNDLDGILTIICMHIFMSVC